MQFTTADRHRRPTVMRQMREKVSKVGKQGQRRGSSQVAEYHRYMVLEDPSGSIRLDQFADGTVHANNDYHSDGGELVRTEKVQRGVTVGTLLAALCTRQTIYVVGMCPRCTLPVSHLQGVNGYHNMCWEAFVLQSSIIQCVVHPLCVACGIGVGGSDVIAIPSAGVMHAGCAKCQTCGVGITADDDSGAVAAGVGGVIAHVSCCASCAVCGSVIGPSAGCWETPAGTFHDACFRCNECRAMLDEDHRLLAGAPYCVVCYRRATQVLE